MISESVLDSSETRGQVLNREFWHLGGCVKSLLGSIGKRDLNFWMFHGKAVPLSVLRDGCFAASSGWRVSSKSNKYLHPEERWKRVSKDADASFINPVRS